MGVYMEFMGTLEWVNSYGKKQRTSVLWRAKAALKKTVNNNNKKQHQFIFHYAPSSYALCYRPDSSLDSECENIKLVYATNLESIIWIFLCHVQKLSFWL
ncbi:hypothetical protein GQ457_01G019550 [Hibiscus cannabinus]